MIIIDESISDKQFCKVLGYLKIDNSGLPEIINIKETYPGIPDEEIIKHLLKENSIFITTDRVFHNKVLLSGKRSIYIDKNGLISETTLKGIIIPEKNKNDKFSELKNSYKVEKTDIHEKLLPEAEKQLKKLRTKRRRIRNYFEGIDNISNIDITLSKKDIKNKVLIGIKIRAISNNGIKLLNASEIYIIENKNTDEKMYLCYVLIALLRLLLNMKDIAIYYDMKEIRDGFDFDMNGRFSELFQTLKSYFNHISIKPVNKGKNIEFIRRKLFQLSNNDVGNEIISGDIEEVMHRLITTGL